MRAIYELAVVYHPDTEVSFEAATKQVKALVTTAKGKIKHEDIWEKRKLAYPIKGQTQGVHVFYEVDIDGERLAELEQQFNIQPEILRYLITKVDIQAREKLAAQAAQEETDGAGS